MSEERKDQLEQQPDEKRRKFLKNAGKIGVAAPTVALLVSATNPKVALGYPGTAVSSATKPALQPSPVRPAGQ